MGCRGGAGRQDLSFDLDGGMGAGVCVPGNFPYCLELIAVIMSFGLSPAPRARYQHRVLCPGPITVHLSVLLYQSVLRLGCPKTFYVLRPATPFT